ncbi:MAG: twin-arginine translocation signal domain-containing protein, partial [Acidobacteriota bacterium]|nr:twin-arginine translocation signal domain-containing protein [Acidobacteriota bacterium]
METPKLSRRTFLQATTATALAAQIAPVLAQPATPSPAAAYPELGTPIPDDGWSLWLDHDARWQEDTLHLPEDVLQRADGTVTGGGQPLPVNPPTGGWQVLSPGAGKVVTLPATVEQHHWAQYGQRPYTPEEYRYAADDSIPQNGAYLGVSWWYRAIDIPATATGKRVFLHIRGAHLRAEVYLNQKLVGYSI